ncbi:MAG: hypothetical protein ABWZ99_16580 [Ilumatobacteraceae bacterium]
MEMSPQRVRSAEFKTVRKGADLDEVRRFLNDVADELERAQNQSTAMEARARAAVARLQEVSDGQVTPAEPPAPTRDEVVAVPADQSETISRTLVLAQRTADALIAEARADAAKVVSTANEEAAATRDSTREMASAMLEEAREEARRAGESERLLAASEVDALKARRDFLESDVDHLEQFLVAQRARVRDAATELIEITDRVPAGLGEVRRPLLSASDDASTDDSSLATPASSSSPSASSSGFTAAPTGAPSPAAPTIVTAEDDRRSDDTADELDPTQAIEIVTVSDDEPERDTDGPLFSLDEEIDDPTPVGAGFDRLDDLAPSASTESDDFRFTFDDDERTS